MIQNILGKYLIHHGVLTEEKLKYILEKEDKARVKLGLMAIAEGLLTVKETEQISRLQLIEDKKFGDIAIENGYLSAIQVGGLINLQNNVYLRFMEVLIEENIIDIADVQKVVAAFQQEYGFSNSHLEALKSGDMDNIVPFYLLGDTAKVTEHVQLLLRIIIRRIDRNVQIGKALKVVELDVSSRVMQAVTGGSGYQSYLVESTGGLLEIASKFAEEDFFDVSEDSLDSCAEFLNCVNGMYVSKLSYELESLELEPPLFYEKDGLISGGEIFIVPITIKDKELLFVVQYM